MEKLMKTLIVALLVGGVLILQACMDDKAQAMVQQVVAIEKSDQCHLCGMTISKFPGPKGQLYSRGISGNMKFCSTRDMFAFILDPENQHNIQQSFVHDMAVTPWGHPEEDTYTDAKLAFYVVGHSKKGAMGPTLASFSKRQDAAAFAASKGGEVLNFEQINLQVLADMTAM